jgi:hypothetical protein
MDEAQDDQKVAEPGMFRTSSMPAPWRSRHINQALRRHKRRCFSRLERTANNYKQFGDLGRSAAYLRGGDNIIEVRARIVDKPALDHCSNVRKKLRLRRARRVGFRSGQLRDSLGESVKGQLIGQHDEADLWIEIAFQEKRAQEGVSPAVVFGISLLFVFLIAALYESWMLPFSVLLDTPMAVFGAFAALWAPGMENTSNRARCRFQAPLEVCLPHSVGGEASEPPDFFILKWVFNPNMNVCSLQVMTTPH